MGRVALISLPWATYQRPSVQLASLKAYLSTHGIKTDCFHLYLKYALKLGYQLYGDISGTMWLPECFGSSLLFPEIRQKAAKLARRCIKYEGFGKINIQNILSLLYSFIEDTICSVNFATYDLVGISVCTNQLTCSLYFAKRLKEKYPAAKIVLGGNSCSESLGNSLLRAFPFIDFVINGEGERPLLKLVEFLNRKQEKRIPKGVFYRDNGQVAGGGCDQFKNLDTLVRPSYLDFFRELYSYCNKSSRFSIQIPVEFGRGCYWNRCNFCNLNLQWKGYRNRDHKMVHEDIRFFRDLFNIIDFNFVDCVLPKNDCERLFQNLAKDRIDYNFFGELRASQSLRNLRTLRAGGLKTAQVGIEALSSSLLKKMNKGFKVIDNLAIMKNGMAAGIIIRGNLITCYPGSDLTDIKQTLNNMDFSRYFYPLELSDFIVTFNSPIYKNPNRFGMKKIYIHPFYADLFPQKILDCLNFLFYWDYEKDSDYDQERLWKPVTNKLEDWRTFYLKSSRNGPPLSYRDGGNFLIIMQTMEDLTRRYHRLNHLERQIYLYCQAPKTIGQIRSIVPDTPISAIEDFLKTQLRMRLMFAEESSYLSLAIHYP